MDMLKGEWADIKADEGSNRICWWTPEPIPRDPADDIRGIVEVFRKGYSMKKSRARPLELWLGVWAASLASCE